MIDFIYELYSYLTDFLKLWFVLWGLMNIALIKNKKVYYILGILQFLSILGITMFYYHINPTIVTMLLTLQVIIVTSFLFKGNRIKLVAYSLLAYTLVLFMDACLAGICSLFHLSDNTRFLREIFNSVNVIILGIVVTIKKIKIKMVSQISISKRIYALLFAGAGTGIMMLAGLVVETNSKYEERAKMIVTVITIVVMICYCSACLMMVFITESRDNYKALSLINQRVIESQQQYYTLVNDKQQEIRSIRHEMKNHLACINGLYKADKLKEMEQYINEVIMSSDVTGDLLDTGNDIVNAILNDAQSRYRKDHIAIRLEGGFPSELNIAPMDLCVIMANVISNAVEAILRMEREREEEFYIDLKISSYKNDLFIDINNPIDDNVQISNGKLVTSKKDKSLHGFGIRNVIQRLEKYQGEYQYKIENHEFNVAISMKNN